MPDYHDDDVQGDDLVEQTPSHEQVRPQTRSLRSWRSGRSRTRSRRSSRPSRPTSLNRIYSAGFHDDHGVYIDSGDFAANDKEATTSPPPTKCVGDEQSKDENQEEKDDDGLEAVESQDFEDPADGEDGDRAAENGELEKRRSLSRRSTRKSTRSQQERDPNMVSWDGADDPESPKNWKSSRKWVAVLVVSSFTFISPVASSMVAPALPQIQNDLGVTNDVLGQMMLSIFILAYAFGPLLFGPLSEVYGRIPVLQLANMFFLIFNLVCGFAQSGTQMLIFRLLAGLGGSAPLSIGGGILADCFTPEQRGKAIAMYSLAPLIGPAAGPVAGGFIAENISWRWVFWIVSIADAVIQVFGLFFLQETWAPKLLEQKAKRLRKETGNEEFYAENASTQPLLKKLSTSLQRPFILLFTQPIIVALGLYMAYLYGLVYLVISSFSTLWTNPDYYNMSVQMSGLHFIALAIGYGVGSQITARFNDWTYKRLKRTRGNGKGVPEFRVPVMIPCAVLLPVGFFWYGWSAEARIFWVMPDIGAAILAAAMICGYQAIQTYVIDAYTTYAASAVASVTFMRSLAGFAFPLFAPQLYNSLGYGWGNSLLAFIGIAIGVPAPWIFWRYGAMMRARSQFAAG